MRLTIFGPGFPLRGGIATTTTALVQALEARGHQVQFITPQRQYPDWMFPGAKDKDPEACPQVVGAQAVFSPVEPWTWIRARRLALDFDADFWIVPYWTWVWAPLWFFVLRGLKGLGGRSSRGRNYGASKSRPPAIAVVHNLNDHGGGGIRRWVARRIFAKCDGFMTHAEILKAALEENFPGAAVAAYPLPAISVDRELPQRQASRLGLGVEAEDRLALFLGIIRPYKGVDILLEAFSLLPQESRWRLIVAGEPWGDLEKTLSTQVEALGLGDRVTLRFGWLPEVEVDQLLSAADLLALPYRSGTQSAVAPMALSRGLPVVSSNVGGLGEVIEHGVSGLLVEPNSAPALARAIGDMDDEKLKELGSGATEASARWTWAGYAEALERLTERL